MNPKTTLPLPAAPAHPFPRRLLDAWRRQRLARATVETLRALDDRTLRDLGMHRCEIRGVAAEMAGSVEPSRLFVLA